MKETEDVQNTVFRLSQEIYLNVEKPSKQVKRLYCDVQKAFLDLSHKLDILNDIKNA